MTLNCYLIHVSYQATSFCLFTVYEHPKIRFGEGQDYRVDPNQLTKIHVGPKPKSAPMGKCQSLKNEAKLLMKRLDRELEKLQQERCEVVKILQGIQQMSEENADTQMDCPSLSSVCGWDRHTQEGNEQVDPMEFADKNLELTLNDSGAFTNYGQVPPQPRPSHLLSHPAQTHSPVRMILPPHNFPGHFGQ